MMNTKIKQTGKFFLVLSLFLFGSDSTVAQEFSDTYHSLKSEFPEEQAVYSKFYEDMDIALVADSIVVKAKHFQEIVHLGEKSNVFAKDQVYSSMFYKVANIEAATLIPYKKKYKAIKVTNFKETFDKNSFVFFDDTRIISFIYPGITQGVHTTLQYDEAIKDCRFIGSFLFATYMPIVHGRYSVTLDKGINIDFQLLNDPDKQVKVSMEDLGPRIKYSYEVFNSKKITRESRSPSVKYYTPHVNTIIRSYKDPRGNSVKVLSSPDDLFAWYKTFIKGLAHHDDPVLKEIVSNLVKDVPTEEEKVKKIFYWVQKNIKYIAFEEGMRGLIPHHGGYVCEKRFGDCKDMSSILVNMMHHAGIKGYFTWIGTRDIPYAYTETPTPLVDNHMIATYINGDKTYFLDATAQYSPFELPSSMIQGKEALVALSDSTYKIMKVPEVSRLQNEMVDSSFFSIENGVVTGSGNVSLSGFVKVINTYRLTTTSEKDIKDYLTHVLGRGSNKFSLGDYTIYHLQNLDKPIKIDYSFNVPNYYRAIGNEIYFNMNLDKSYNGDVIDKTRELPMENEFKYSHQSVSVLEIPANYQLEHIPANDSFSNDVFGYSIKYKPEKDRIIMEKEFFVDYLLLESQDFEKWNEVVKKLSEAYSESVILKNKEV